MTKKSRAAREPDAESLLGEFAERLRATGRQPATVDAYCHDARLFLAYLNQAAIKSLTSINDETLDDFTTHLRDHLKHRPNSARRALLGVRLFFRFLHDGRFIRGNPLEETAIPIRVEVRQRPLTKEQVQSFMENAASEAMPLKASRDRSILALLAWEGVKTSELVSLCWNDFLPSATRPTLRVGGARPRAIALQPQTAELLVRYQMEYDGQGAPALHRAPEKRMFVGFKGPRCGLILPTMSRHGLKFLLYEIGAPSRVNHLNAEMLRSYATRHLLSIGLSPEDVMRRLGLRQIGAIARHIPPRRPETSND